MLRRIFLTMVGLVLVGALLLAGFLYWSAKEAEPRYSGELGLSGLAAPVTVRFGPHAVPTIEADSLDDLLFAQGFIVASERMWQMDLMRRLAEGRLAEVLGEDALPADRWLRTIGLGRLARERYRALEPKFQRMLAAYAAGVNAYRQDARGRLPLEYRLAGFRPAPWQPEDSLAIAAYMSWMLSFNAREELTFLRLAARLGDNDRAAELFPTDEGVPAPSPDPSLPLISADLATSFSRLAALPARFGLPVPGAASNSWAVSAHRTADGNALLANDPHLAAAVPSTWYELELMAPGLHVAGVALPGVPLVLIGHNADLAWGFTTTIADTQDLFIERATADGGHVERAGGRVEPIGERVERISVAGRAAPFEQIVRTTSRGILINEALSAASGTAIGLPAVGSEHLIALRWNFDADDRSFPALYRLSKAKSLVAAREAIGGFRQASQNLMLAHRDGGIGWQVTGRLPKRGRGRGAFPLPGWVADADWQGYVPIEANPGVTDPPEAQLITANNRTIPLGHPVNVGQVWLAPYRAQRIAELLATEKPISVEAMAAMQRDRYSIQAGNYQRALRRMEPELRRIDAGAWAVAERLLDWDCEMDPTSHAGALFAALEAALYEALYRDELDEDLTLLMDLSTSTYDPLQEAVYSDKSSFWDDVSTAATEGPAEIWARALRHAAEHANGRRLGELRTLEFPHAFDGIPLLGRFFSVGPVSMGGYGHTVNVAKGTPSTVERVLFVPSLRVVYTPADWGLTRGTLPLGQSGHRFSRYRTDQLDDWRAGEAHAWPWNGPRDSAAIGVLLLRPATLQVAPFVENQGVM